MKVKSESEVAQSCRTLSDPMDYSLPGSIYNTRWLYRKEKSSQSNNTLFHLEKLKKKDEEIKPRVSRRKEIIKVKAEIHDIQKQNNNRKINEINIKIWFCERINKISKSLARLMSKKEIR